MKLLFYTMCFLGVAPYIRSLALSRKFLQDFDVDYIHGGVPLISGIDSPRFKEIALPSFTVKYPDNKLIPSGNFKTIPEVFFARKQTLTASLKDSSYNAFMTELFPFQKLKLWNEISYILKQIKKTSPQVKMVGSFRDCIDEVILKEQRQTAEIILQYYDKILIHTDPNFIKLEDSYSFTHLIQHKIVYTGFIPNGTILSDPPPREKRILVTMGGGAFGQILVKSVADIADRFPDYEFVMIMGPRSPTELRNYIEEKKRIPGFEGITISEFIPDLCAALQRCSLSISLGGYTLIDVVCTGTPSLALPYHLNDQTIRTKKLSNAGLVKIINEEDLEKNRLTAAIQDSLSAPHPSYQINANGLENSRKELLSIINSTN